MCIGIQRMSRHYQQCKSISKHYYDHSAKFFGFQALTYHAGYTMRAEETLTTSLTI